MNEQFQQLYNYVKANNMTDLDAQSFYDAYSDPEKFSDLYGYVKGQNMTDLGQDEFYAAYFGELKKKRFSFRAFGFQFGGVWWYRRT